MRQAHCLLVATRDVRSSGDLTTVTANADMFNACIVVFVTFLTVLCISQGTRSKRTRIVSHAESCSGADAQTQDIPVVVKLENELSKLRLQNGRLVKANNLLQKEAGEQQQQIQLQKAELEIVTAAKDTLIESLQREKSSLGADVQRLRNDNTQLENNAATQRIIAVQLQEDNTRLQTDMGMLQGSYGYARTRIVELQHRLNEMEHLVSHLTSL